MKFSFIELLIIGFYLLSMAVVGVVVRRRATKRLDSYFLGDRNVPWWMLGLSGCSSYIDIGGTMAMVGALFYLGLKAMWVTHIYWGWFMICFYMAFQARWIRTSGVMTFAEWNRTRFGDTRDAEAARLAAAVFLLVLMVCNLMYMSVGIGKFAEEFLRLERWQATLVILSVVGIYVTLGGFFGVIVTDIIQTVFIAAGAVLLAAAALASGGVEAAALVKDPAWFSLAPAWKLWPGFAATTPAAYLHFQWLGPVLISGFGWMVFRLLAGPNVWDFQFFLTARSPRDAQLAGGMWTVGYTLRWVIGCAFLVLGISYFGGQAGFDAEKIIPLVLLRLPAGLRGLFVAVLLAALMSTLSAMINVTSSVVTNDFVKRYIAKGLDQKKLVRVGQAASVVALALGFLFSLAFSDIVTAWEVMIFIVVTVILVPATMRWHYWRMSARAFVIGMAASAGAVVLRLIFLRNLAGPYTLALDVGLCIAATLAAVRFTRPTDMDTLVEFYSRVRPFGFWRPVRQEAVRRGLVRAGDRQPVGDVLNGLLTACFQFSLALIPFTFFLGQRRQTVTWAAAALAIGGILYFTWFRSLPPRTET